MTFIDKQEITLILNALDKVYGPGYSSFPGVAQLQAKLSIMLEVKTRAEEARKP
jgi:hypothetical protein